MTNAQRGHFTSRIVCEGSSRRLVACVARVAFARNYYCVLYRECCTTYLVMRIITLPRWPCLGSDSIRSTPCSEAAPIRRNFYTCGACHAQKLSWTPTPNSPVSFATETVISQYLTAEKFETSRRTISRLYSALQRGDLVQEETPTDSSRGAEILLWLRRSSGLLEVPPTSTPVKFVNIPSFRGFSSPKSFSHF